MPGISLPNNARFDIKYREQYVSEALNKKQYKIDPQGIYQGFWLTKDSNTQISLRTSVSGGGLNHSIALVESNGVAVKVEIPVDISITINEDDYVEDIWTIWLVVNYQMGVPTNGSLQILSSTSPQPANSIGVGCFRVLENPLRVDDVFPLHKGITTASKSFFYQGASIGYTRDLMTKHYITQNGDFKNGFQGWNWDNAELEYTLNANNFASFVGVKLNTNGRISSDLYPITTTDLYLGISVKRANNNTIFDGNIELGYLLFDKNRMPIGSIVSKKVAIGGQPNDGSSFTWLAYVDKISNVNAKFISIGVMNYGSSIIINRIYGVLPFDENDIYVSGSNLFYKNLIANEFQTNNIEINTNSTGIITKPVMSDFYWFAMCKSGCNVVYQSDYRSIRLELNPSGVISVMNSSKVRVLSRYLRFNLQFRGNPSFSDVNLTCYVHFYKKLSDTLPVYTWQPKFHTTGTSPIPLNKIISTIKSDFEMDIDFGGFGLGELNNYRFMQVEIIFSNTGSTNRSIEILDIKVSGEDNNEGASEFTDIIVKGELDSSNNLFGGRVITNGDISIRKLANNISNAYSISSDNRRISFGIDENNKRVISFWSKVAGIFLPFNVIYDGANGITADLDEINISDNGKLNLGSNTRLNLGLGSKLLCGGANLGKINIDNVDHDHINFAGNLGANPSTRFTAINTNIQSQINSLSDRYYQLGVYFDRYKATSGSSDAKSERLYYIWLKESGGTYYWYSAGIFTTKLTNRIRNIRVPFGSLYFKNVVLTGLYFCFKFNRAIGDSVNRYYTETRINLGVSRSTYASVLYPFTTNDINWLNNNAEYYLEVSPAIVNAGGVEQNYAGDTSGNDALEVFSYASGSSRMSVGNYLEVQYTDYV